jgi:hypothetical protein
MKILLLFLISQFDITGMTEADYIATKLHRARLMGDLKTVVEIIDKENSDLKLETVKLKQSNREAEDSAKEAKSDLAAVKKTIDNLVIARDNAEAGEKAEAALKWKWIKWCVALSIIDFSLLAWIFRKPIARLCGIPIP